MGMKHKKIILRWILTNKNWYMKVTKAQAKNYFIWLKTKLEVK